MKIKITFIIIVSFLLLLSITQIFSIPPYEDDIIDVYKSGYFRELDREFSIIADSFIGIKSMAKPAFAWIFLKDMAKDHDMEIKIFNDKGYRIKAPGIKSEGTDDDIVSFLRLNKSKKQSDTFLGKYYQIMPLKGKKSCYICHVKRNKNNIIGVLTFSKKYDSHVYYSAERVILFILISILLSGALFLIIKWEPAKNVKELFDK